MYISIQSIINWRGREWKPQNKFLSWLPGLFFDNLGYDFPCHLVTHNAHLCSSLVPCSYSCSELLSFQITDFSCCFSELPKRLPQSAHQLSIPDMHVAPRASPVYHCLGGETLHTGLKRVRRESQCNPEENWFAKPTQKQLPSLKFHRILSFRRVL